VSTHNCVFHMSTEIYHLFKYDTFWDPNQLELIPVGPPSPTQVVTFKILAGTGFDWNFSPLPDWDDAYITWTGEDGLPIADLEDANCCDADRSSARDIYRELKTLGYQRHLLGSH